MRIVRGLCGLYLERSNKSSETKIVHNEDCKFCKSLEIVGYLLIGIVATVLVRELFY